MLGDNGRFGLAYAIELAQQEGGEGVTSPHPEWRGECASETPDAEKPSPRETELVARVAELERALATRVAELESATRQKVGSNHPQCRCVIGARPQTCTPT